MKNKEAHYDAPGKLMQRTLELLKASDKSLLEIYNETGLPFYWLRKFAGGTFQNPSVNRVQFLYEHLTRQPLL